MRACTFGYQDFRPRVPAGLLCGAQIAPDPSRQTDRGRARKPPTEGGAGPDEWVQEPLPERTRLGISSDSKTTAEVTVLTFPADDLLANDSKGPANESAQTLTVVSVDTITDDGTTNAR